jgi:uncharacterized protein YggE
VQLGESVGILRSLVFAVVLVNTSCTLESAVANERTISVNGVGVVAAASDVAVVRLGVESLEETARDAMRVSNERTQSILTALKKLGVVDKDLRTEALQLHPQYEHLRDKAGRQTQNLVGYRASNVVSVRLSDIAKAGDAIDATIQAGANRIDSIAFEVSDPQSAVRAARDAAWADALQQAEQLTLLAGTKLGVVQRMSTHQQAPRPVQEMSLARSMKTSVPLQGGQQLLSVQIDVTWELAP